MSKETMPLGVWQDKVWGRTKLTEGSGVASSHELHLMQGGYCSIHWHEQRDNHFRVLSGEVAVVQFRSFYMRTKILTPEANYALVMSRVPHMFLVLKPGTMIETYSVLPGDQFSLDDIIRVADLVDDDNHRGGRLLPDKFSNDDAFRTALLDVPRQLMMRGLRSYG